MGCSGGVSRYERTVSSALEQRQSPSARPLVADYSCVRLVAVGLVLSRSFVALA